VVFSKNVFQGHIEDGMIKSSVLREVLTTGTLPLISAYLHGSALRLCDLFEARFPGSSDRPVVLGFVPARIEVLGKHTDYAGGHTIVCAIDRGFLFLAGENLQGVVRMAEDSPEFPPLEFPLDENIVPPLGSWANYPMTMARRVIGNFGKQAVGVGADIAFLSDLPVGSGMSGSSALMMLTFCVLSWVNRLHETERFRANIGDGIDLAMYLACGENGQTFRDLVGGRGVGTFGGSEDHTAILNCRKGRLSLYQYAPTVPKAEMEWPEDWAIVVAFCGVRAEKTREALEKYNLASRRASLAVEACNREYGTNHRNLREALGNREGASEMRWLDELDARLGGDPALGLADRVRHFVGEERVHMPRAIRALLWRDMETFGAALSASHDDSRRYLWNIAPEIDFLKESALGLGASGATGFGAGFGGSIAAVLPAERADSFTARWQAAYARQYPGLAAGASFFRASPGPGIVLWDSQGAARWVDRVFPGSDGGQAETPFMAASAL
jgi:galactokinase